MSADLAKRASATTIRPNGLPCFLGREALSQENCFWRLVLAVWTCRPPSARVVQPNQVRVGKQTPGVF